MHVSKSFVSMRGSKESGRYLQSSHEVARTTKSLVYIRTVKKKTMKAKKMDPTMIRVFPVLSLLVKSECTPGGGGSIGKLKISVSPLMVSHLTESNH